MSSPPEIAPRFAVPVAWIPDAVRAEVDAFIVDASVPEVRGLPTRCPPWTVDDLTKHLAATFHRFTEMLRWSRTGRFDPPFAPEELDRHNLEMVRTFRGDPLRSLCEESARFLTLAIDPDEPIAHQRGVIPVAMQMLFAAIDVTIHHDDLAVARGGRYEPPPETVAAMLPAMSALTGDAPGGSEDAWVWLLRRSGRDQA